MANAMWGRSVFAQGVNDLTHRVWSFVVGLVVTALSTLAGAYLLSPERVRMVEIGPPPVVEVAQDKGDILVGALYGFLIGIGALLVVWLLYSVLIGPYRQRNKLREDYRSLVDQTNSPFVRASNAYWFADPRGTDDHDTMLMVDATITNRGTQNMNLEFAVRSYLPLPPGHDPSPHDVSFRPERIPNRMRGNRTIEDSPLFVPARGPSPSGMLVFCASSVDLLFLEHTPRTELVVTDLIAGNETTFEIDLVDMREDEDE